MVLVIATTIAQSHGKGIVMLLLLLLVQLQNLEVLRRGIYIYWHAAFLLCGRGVVKLFLIVHLLCWRRHQIVLMTLYIGFAGNSSMSAHDSISAPLVKCESFSIHGIVTDQTLPLHSLAVVSLARLITASSSSLHIQSAGNTLRKEGIVL